MKIYVAKEHVKYEGSRVITVRENLDDVKKDIDNEVKSSYGFMKEVYIEVWELGSITNTIDYDISEIKKEAYSEYMRSK